MAAGNESVEFEGVSRLKGTVFEYLSLAASSVGIVMLAILLVYVSVDAFGLARASAAWLFTYFATVALPFVGFCVYSADDKAVTRRVVLALAGGVVASFVVFQGFELVVRPIPGLDWHLGYLFGFVLPTAVYASVAASDGEPGETGFGLLGRLFGGAALGLGAVSLFLVFDPFLWTLGYSLGLLPAAAVYLYARRNPRSPASLLVVPVAVAGFVAAAVVHAGFATSLSRFIMYLWTLVLPATVGLAVAFYRRRSRRFAVAASAAVFVFVVVAATTASGFTGMQNHDLLLVVLGATVPTASYLERTLERGGRRRIAGLGLPLLIAAGVAVGAVAVGALGFAAPDPWLDAGFLTQVYSQVPEEAGFYPAIVGSVFVIALVALISFSLGVGTAVFLEDYAPDEGLLGGFARLIQVNIANLAAVPSIVYGLLGLGVFVNLLDFGLGTGVTAALTLSLLILPITVISAQEAVRSVPDSRRQASYAMGATRWQTTRNVVLPEALPGVLTGVILALGRAIGETAPLIMIGAPHVVFSAPESVWDKMTAMPMQIFVWSSSAQSEFRYGVLAAGVVTLLIVLLGMNTVAIVLRNRSERGG